MAAESAVYLLGYTRYRPRAELLGAPPGLTVPPALRDFRIVRWDARLPPVWRQGLPVWSPSTLIAAIASRPSFISDWPQVAGWLPLAGQGIAVEDVARELEGRAPSAWARTSYLLERAGERSAARTLRRRAPWLAGPARLGSRCRPGKHFVISNVIDSTGLWEECCSREWRWVRP